MFRFGGEGAGFTPVVNHAKYLPQGYGHTITLDGTSERVSDYLAMAPVGDDVAPAPKASRS